MANGLQIAASGLIAQEMRLDTIANDIANVSTVGYEQSRTAFSEVLGTSGGVRTDDIGKTADEGAFATSDNPIAVGLDGSGYLQGRSANGAGPRQGPPPNAPTARGRDGDLHIAGARTPAPANGPKLAPPISVPANVDP